MKDKFIRLNSDDFINKICLICNCKYLCGGHGFTEKEYKFLSKKKFIVFR